MSRLAKSPFLLLAALCLAWLPPLAGAAEKKLDPVSLQLKWTHCFQFAGYYAAEEQGYYRQAGLEVTLREAKPGQDIVGEVVSGRAQFGVGNSSLMIDRKRGQPVVVLAVVFQHSPSIIIARGQSPSMNIHDLAGKRMMIEDLTDELKAYLLREGIPADRITLLPHTFQLQDLADGKVDALTAYLSNEPYFLRKAGIPHTIFSPRSAGIDFYGDNLFTTEEQIRLHPERVRAFREASLRGWQYAMAHPDETIRLIHRKYENSPPPEAMHYEAETISDLIKPTLVPVGFMYTGRWEHIASIYAELGMLPRHFSLNGFLYDAEEGFDAYWLNFSLVVALVVIALGGIIVAYISRINRRLAKSLADVQVLQTAIEQSPTSIVITQPNSVIEYVNPHFAVESGYTAAEAVGKTPKILNSGLTDPKVFAEMWETLRAGRSWTGEFFNRHKSGGVFCEEAHIAPVKDKEGKTTHYVAVKLDITDRKRAQEKLAYLAHHDPLTGLANRTLFFNYMELAQTLALRNKTRLALLMLDLDRFKPINDLYGHATGDLVLQQVTRRLLAGVRASDTVGRIGGDEFIILLNTVDVPEHAVHVAEKIRMAVRQPIQVEEIQVTVSVTVSIGIVIFPDHGRDPKILARLADLAMYQAKSRRRDAVQLYDPSASWVESSGMPPPGSQN